MEGEGGGGGIVIVCVKAHAVLHFKGYVSFQDGSDGTELSENGQTGWSQTLGFKTDG